MILINLFQEEAFIIGKIVLYGIPSAHCVYIQPIAAAFGSFDLRYAH